MSHSDHPTVPAPRLEDLQRIVAFRVVDSSGGTSLHHGRERALQAAVERHGVVAELVELTPELRRAIQAWVTSLQIIHALGSTGVL